MTKIRLLIVGDDLILANELKNQLIGLGYEVVGIEATGDQAVERVSDLASRNKLPDILLIETGLAGVTDPIESAKLIRKKHNCGIIFLTPESSKPAVFSNSFLQKPPAFLYLPADISQARMVIELVYHQQNLESDYRRITEDLKTEVERRKKAEKEAEQHLQEKLKSGKKMDHLLKSHRQMERDLINRELASSSIFISQKNKIIALLRKEMNRHLRKGQSMTKADFAKSLKTIDENVKFENEWYRIKAHFEKIHPGFFDRLRVKFPNLTPNDHKLCALLRMNLSTKEISQILKITTPSTEISRIRLRKKMALPKNLNLVQYICNI